MSDSPIKGDVVAMARGYANQLAENPTEAERRVYEALSKCHINFLFQYPLYIRNDDGEVVRFYIADFYLPEKSCIVEVDGGYHDDSNQEEVDRIRTADIKLSYPNMTIIRILNEEAFDHKYLDAFVQEIRKLQVKIDKKEKGF